MDRAEQSGLAIALVGHGALFAALSLSLSARPEPFKPANPPMAVELVAETAMVSSAPDAVRDASPPPLASAPVVPEPVAVPVPLPVNKPRPEPVIKPPSPKMTKPVKSVKPVVEPKQVRTEKKQINAKPNPQRTKLDLSLREMSAAARKEASQTAERTGTGRGQGKTGSGTPAVKTAAEVRRDIRVSLAAEIFPHWKKCVPSGVDISLMETQLDLKINPDGSLAGVSNVAQTGVNDSNKAQQQRHKECAMKAVQLASPFKLDAADYEVWKTWPMTFKATERK